MSRFRHQPDALNSQTSQHSENHAAGENQFSASVPSSDLEAIALRQRSPISTPVIQPSFKILIGLTLLTALLLLPFAVSDRYLDLLRGQSVDLHPFLRGELYKQGTGYAALTFVLLEILLTVRKRSRSWIGRIKIPGSMQLWRSTHIFVGVGLVGLILIHTVGANGLNFNAIFLWVFFATTLTALMGVVAETGILESTRRYFGTLPGREAVLTKGRLIRGLRSLWLASHIFLVCVFMVMLMFHIILAYYYQ